MWGDEGFGGHGAGNGFGNFPNTLDSPAGGGKSKQVRRHQNVLPIVIRQIRDCKEEEFKLFSLDAQIVVIVGILRSYEVLSTKATYEIEDHTGRISATLWLENDGNNAPSLPLVKEGNYVRVFGSLRNIGGHRSLMILKIFAVDNANIVTSHLLQVIHARLEAENMSKNDVTQIHVNHPGAELANSMSFMSNSNSNFMSHTNAVSNNGFTRMQQKVYDILKADKSPTGLARSAILQHFPPNQHHEVNHAIEFLTAEGHTYSTIDNEHFKNTESS